MAYSNQHVYRSPISTNIKIFFLELSKTLDIATSRYDNLIVMGDLNIDVDDPNASGMQDLNGLLISYDLSIITKGKTCTTWGHESSLDIILTNKPKSHMHTTSLELGISDFHKMSLTILKSQLSRLKPRKITYRSYKNFNVEHFLEELSEMFEKRFPEGDSQNSDLTYNPFVNILVMIL